MRTGSCNICFSLYSLSINGGPAESKFSPNMSEPGLLKNSIPFLREGRKKKSGGDVEGVNPSSFH